MKEMRKFKMNVKLAKKLFPVVAVWAGLTMAQASEPSWFTDSMRFSISDYVWVFFDLPDKLNDTGCIIGDQGPQAIQSFPLNELAHVRVESLLACCRANFVKYLPKKEYLERLIEEGALEDFSKKGLYNTLQFVVQQWLSDCRFRKITGEQRRFLAPLVCRDVPWKTLLAGVRSLAEDFDRGQLPTLAESLMVLNLHPVLPWYQFWCCVSQSGLEVYTRAIAASLQKVIIDRVASKQDSNSLLSWQDIVDKAKGQNSIGQKGEGPLLHRVHADAETPLLGEAVANEQQEIEDAERDIVIAYKWMIETYPFWPGKGK